MEEAILIHPGINLRLPSTAAAAVQQCIIEDIERKQFEEEYAASKTRPRQDTTWPGHPQAGATLCNQPIIGYAQLEKEEEYVSKTSEYAVEEEGQRLRSYRFPSPMSTVTVE
ncbi:hypothetical protein HGRIS_010698 [Hohenbuehelia grisea]|uniref:Uncharacterized protein n=1 Tax=Hohenbuehelia grisea TaxID=104357 RepID=A0ABR3IXL2_9AGAR